MDADAGVDSSSWAPTGLTQGGDGGAGIIQEWTREEKDHCLEETEKSFKYSGAILRLLVS